MPDKYSACVLLLLVASCTSEAPLAPGGGNPAPTNPPDSSGNVIIINPQENGLQPIVRTPFCCSSLDREFSVLLDGSDLRSGTTCTWSFGDGFTADDCEAAHAYPWAGEFDVVVSVRSPDGTILSTEFRLQLGAQTPVADTSAIALAADAGEDLVAVPGQRVALHPIVSVTPEDSLVTVSWRQVSGPTVYLEAAFSTSPSFVMPELHPGGLLEFELIATSGSLTATSRIAVTAGDSLYEDAVYADDPQFGYDPADATAALQRAIDAGSAVAVIPDVGRDWLVGPITLRSNLRLVLEPGVVLAAKPGAYPGEYDSVLTAELAQNVVIEGYGAVIRMPRDEYIPPFEYPDYVAGEWRHAIAFRGVQGGEILGVRVEGTGGDGIYISSAWDHERTHCSDILVRDCYVQSSYRNGISITSGEDILVDECTVTGTNGTPPKAGVIVEPNHFRDRLINIEIRNTTVVDNEGTGFVVSFNRLFEQSLPVSILISDCKASYSGQPSLRAMMSAESAPRGHVEFRRCEVEEIVYSGAWGRWDPGAAIRLSFVDCTWRNVGRHLSITPIAFEIIKSASQSPLGGIEFSGCTLFDEKMREPFALSTDNVVEESFNVFGELRVISEVRGRNDEAPAEQCPNLLLDYATSEDGP